MARAWSTRDYPFAIRRKCWGPAFAQAHSRRPVATPYVQCPGLTASLTGLVKRDQRSVIAQVARDCPIMPAQVTLFLVPGRQSDHSCAQVISRAEHSAVFRDVV